LEEVIACKLQGANGVVIDSTTIAMIELAAGDDEQKLAHGIQVAEECAPLSMLKIYG
jgi:hypothetical protein